MMKLNQQWLYDEEVIRIINAIEKYNGNIRFIGGCVRDSLLDREVNDIDIVTDLIPKKVILALEDSAIKVVPTGIKHGTVTAIMKKKSFEITTLRADIHCDGRHANVEFTTNWQLDAARRDFTFNAIYCDKEGILYDYFSGLEDLKLRKLRFIGNPQERIEEDYLRILRVFRFYGLICHGELSEEIMNECTKYADKILLLSKERVRDEFFKILSSKNVVASLEKMEQCTLLKYILPYQISYKILLSQNLQDVKPLVKLASMLRINKNHDRNIADKISDILRLSNKQRNELIVMLKTDLPNLPWSVIEQKKYIVSFGHEMYYNLVKILHAELNDDKIDNYLSFGERFEIPFFPISGVDLVEIGYREGRELGEVIKQLKIEWEKSSYSLTKSHLLELSKRLCPKK